MTGILYGVGVGPGDPSLLTLSAIQCIETADAVAYPCLEGTASFARHVVENYLKSDQEEIPIIIPMKQDPEPAQLAYDQAAEHLFTRIKKGKNVAVLCEGDPFFYGSFQFLFYRLAKKCSVKIIPGVSSLMSCAASLALPLAARNDVLSVLPAPLPNTVLQACLNVADTAAIIKLGRHFSRIKDLLSSLNLDQSAYYIERSSLPNEKIEQLENIDPSKVPYFSMILVNKRS